MPDPVQQRAELIDKLTGNGWSPTGTADELLLASEVALLFQVTEHTIGLWAREGRLPSVRTPGGRRRYPTGEMLRLLSEQSS